MAKQIQSISFTNATIDVAADEIAEFRKDDILTSRLSEVLKQFDGIEGVSLTIKRENVTQVNSGAADV